MAEEETKQKHKAWLEKYSNKKTRYLIVSNEKDINKKWELNYKSENYDENINLIEIADNELVIEFDENNKSDKNLVSTQEQRVNWTKATVEKLKEEKIGFLRYSHGGKCDHIHISLSRASSKKEKEKATLYYIPAEARPFVDLSLCGSHLIAVPFAKHWKYGNYKQLIEKSPGEAINIESILSLSNVTLDIGKVARERFNSELNIIDIALKYGLRKCASGQNWHCPFHKDENPSLNISEERGIYNCFGCGKHGNIFSFVYELEKVNTNNINERYESFCEIVRMFYHNGSKNYVKLGQDLIIRYLKRKFYFLTPQDSRKIFVYSEGIYKPEGTVFISQEIQKILGNENSNQIVTEIIGHIVRSSYIEREKFTEPLNMICLKNGVFNMDLMQLVPFSPDYIFLNKVPVNFIPRNDCPNIKKFLYQVLTPRKDWNDSDHVNTDVVTMQEFMGYFLYKLVKFNRAVMLYGDGENGKSTVINLIKSFLGEKNVANVAIQKLERDKFAVSSLYGKLANLHSDLPKTALNETSIFKQLTGGDPIDAEKKFGDNFSFSPYTKMMYAANTLPETYDDTRAFWRRWIMFKFPNNFSESERTTNKNLLGELTTDDELSGLFNWAMEGLKRLLKNERFTLNKGTEEVRIEYIRKSDSVGAFILDRIEEVANNWIPKRELFEAYADYCRKNNYNMLENNSFHRVFHKKVNVREYNPVDSTTKKQIKAWTGVKLKEQLDKLSEEEEST